MKMNNTLITILEWIERVVGVCLQLLRQKQNHVQPQPSVFEEQRPAIVHEEKEVEVIKTDGEVRVISRVRRLKVNQ